MATAPELVIDPSMRPLRLIPALVWARGLSVTVTGTVPAWLSPLLARVAASGESFLGAARKAAVRDMLRHGKYKPAGRAKPSSEYLLAAALEGAFPLVNGPVDVNNGLSLEYGWPASVFDLEKCGESLLLRRGQAGESYVFNPSGQEIDLEDLLCVCRRSGAEWKPCGNPVKDAMETKVFETARDVAALVYAPLSEGRPLVEECAARFSALLSSECGAAQSGWKLVE